MENWVINCNKKECREREKNVGTMSLAENVNRFFMQTRKPEQEAAK